MPVRKPLTFKGRLVLLIVAAVGLSQVIIGAVSAGLEGLRHVELRRATLMQSATVLASGVSRPLAEGDVEGAYPVLASIARMPGILHVAVDDSSGKRFAEMGTGVKLAGGAVVESGNGLFGLAELLGGGVIEAAVPVVRGGETLGRLALVADVSDLPARLLRAVGFSLAGTSLALAVVIAFALRMQRRIARPLVDLAATMTEVSRAHDYRVTLKPEADDEVGALVTSFNRMIGEIRSRDDKLARHRARLEQDVAERTEDYRRAQAAAEAASEAKSDFLATMSHEIRTPMNGMLVMAELLAASPLPPSARRQAEVIARSGESLLAIINDILDFSKIEAGRMDLEPMPVDVATAADTVMRLFGERARGKGLDLACRLDLPCGTAVTADPVRLGQVLGNLVNNALKFTESGGVVLAVEPDARAPGHLRFSVTDTGIGIAPEAIGTIFGAFSQADQSTTRRFGGTGLGLSIARHLVGAMGGTIAVESRVGEGSTFFFSLPVDPAASTTDWPRLAPDDRAFALVAVAGAATSGVVCAMLTGAGFRVIEADAATDLAAAARGARLVIAEDGRPLAGVRAVLAPGAVVAVVGAPGAAGPAGADVDLARPVSRTELSEIVEDLAAGRDPAARRRETSAVARLPRHAGARVLVADDGAVNREVASAALAEFGIVADCVENGRLALEAVRARRYDLVLMDGSMPELDGFAASRAIRAFEAEIGRPRTPVVALTAHVVGSGADAWREADMDGVLHKPFKLEQLAAVLEAHCPRSEDGAGAFSSAVAADIRPDEPAATEAEQPLVDPAVLDDLRGMMNGEAVARRVAGLYRDHAPKAIEMLEMALDKSDTEEIGAAAHGLKSMSHNVGARAVAAAAAAIERTSRGEGRLPDRKDVADLAGLLARTIEALAGDDLTPAVDRRAAL